MQPAIPQLVAEGSRDAAGATGEAQLEEAQADQCHLAHFDKNWVAPLTHENVLDYFVGSPFFDPSCDNNIIRMQRLPPTHLLNMTGIQYRLSPHVAPEAHHVPPNVEHPLFVIEKIRRSSPTDVRVLSVYYVWFRTIYQAPSLYALINCRVVRATSIVTVV